MIVVTGAAGFIGSVLIKRLNQMGRSDLVLVDHFGNPAKEKNIEGKSFSHKVEREDFFQWAESHASQIEVIFHLGARTDTTEFDTAIFDRLNVAYSISIFSFCTRHQIPLLYASSAATYGNGEKGYSDDPALIPFLKPLNPYGWSKQEFDRWVMQREEKPPHWYGFKFFNVYGPNEYHKGRMASVVFHAFNQIITTGRVKLFKSHRPEYADGMQLRDFVYVLDVVQLMLNFWQNLPESGIYNAGTGKAEPFLHLAEAVFEALSMEPSIDFIDTPADIRDKYQYFTEADMRKACATGLCPQFRSLREGVKEYVGQYLAKGLYL
ncbi:MAG: ADP-glyceromanno-heptose 6-epimerase [Bacteroidales bacterium]|jgi:ADP-L-glycero-D-manno-heptose 6-epimerase|nr:ADP-glyceromanno-heptose 6-epimerase [Bacteroidales bacterium]NPV36767.1 ADP-glyceromanno-heptose 6-epimerase [Bacteroidales bacterium]